MSHLADVLKMQFTKVSRSKDEIEETAVATVAGETVEYFTTPFLTPIGGIILGALVGCTAQRVIHNHHHFFHG